MTNLRIILQATAEGGHVVINSQQGLGWGGSSRHAEEASVRDASAQGNTALREAVAAVVCDDEAAAAAAIGDLDGCDEITYPWLVFRIQSTAAVWN